MTQPQFTQQEVDTLNSRMAERNMALIAQFKARLEQGFKSAKFVKSRLGVGPRWETTSASETLIVRLHHIWWYPNPVYTATWVRNDGISDLLIERNSVDFTSLDDLALNMFSFYPFFDEWRFD